MGIDWSAGVTAWRETCYAHSMREMGMKRHHPGETRGTGPRKKLASLSCGFLKHRNLSLIGIPLPLPTQDSASSEKPS